MPDPMWRQIAEDLLKKIEAGELGSDGQALPSEIDLRVRYDASPTCLPSPVATAPPTSQRLASPRGLPTSRCRGSKYSRLRGAWRPAS
jgi:hypothetical protein